MSDDRKLLVQYREDDHVTVLLLDAPPVDTCSHEMMVAQAEFGGS